MSEKTKITIIGAGPGGYEAAIMASKLGAEVTIIEKDHLGGTCLNQGCIPTKVFLASAEVYYSADHAETFGINVGELHRIHGKVLQRKNKSVKQLRKGIQGLFDSNNITLIRGTGRILDPHTVLVKTKEGEEMILESDYIIIATGSEPIIPDVLHYDAKKVISSNELLKLDDLPKSIIIIGGNVVAAEVGQYLARFGVKVVMIEALDHIIPFEDPDVSRQLLRQFKKDKLKVLTNTRVKETHLTDTGVEVITEDGETYTAEKILVCIGRKPNTSEIGLENLEIDLDEKGFIKVDETLKTSVDSIYAIGDVVRTPMLAHVASHEGIAAVNNILGEAHSINYETVPRCIYTDPEIAAVGKTEKELQRENKEYKVGTFNYKTLGKALAINKPLGFAKVITDKNDVIIGASIVGTKASEQLTELSMAIDLGLTAEYLGNIMHPHPTLSEAIMEACRDVNHKSINKLN